MTKADQSRLDDPATPPIAPGPPGRRPPDLMRDDVPCLRCGYNLRGLHETGRCPECGTPIERSVNGNLLLYSDRAFLATLHRGLALIIAGTSCFIVVMGITIALGLLQGITQGRAINILISWASILYIFLCGIAVIQVIGWLMFSAPDPAFVGTDLASRSRSVVRVTVAIGAIASLIILSADHLPQSMNSQSLRVVAISAVGVWAVTHVVKFFASLLYLRWIAARLPSAALDKQAKRLMWLVPVLAVFGPCTAFIALGVGLGLYLHLLNRVRREIRGICDLSND